MGGDEGDLTQNEEIWQGQCNQTVTKQKLGPCNMNRSKLTHNYTTSKMTNSLPRTNTI